MAKTSDSIFSSDVYAAFAERALFSLLLAVVAVRPLLAESFVDPNWSFLRAATPGAGPGVATTAWLDLLALALAAATWWRHPPRAAPRWLLVGIGLVVAAVAVSTAMAGDRRAALNGGVDLLAGVIAVAALASACRRRWMSHVLLAAGLATAGCAALKCVQQWRYEFADTLERWERVDKPRLLAEGYDVSSPEIENFERRLRSAEAYGYGTHPNVAAACLHAALLPAAALVIVLLSSGSWSPTRGIALALSLALAGFIGLALWLTGSLGGVAAAIAGVTLLVLWWAACPADGRDCRWLRWLVLGGYLALVVGGAAWGLARGSLPGASLAFRWEYWTAAGEAIAERPLTGYGRENFITPYLLHKSPESTEQVRNPHGLWVALPVELGLLGLAGGAVLLLGALGRLLRPPDRVALASPLTPAPSAHALHAAAIVLALHALFSGTPFAEPGVAIVWAVDVAAVYLFAFFAALRGIEVTAGAARGQAALVAGGAAALLAALVHNLIDYSLFTPAGLAAVGLPLAAAWSLQRPTPESAAETVERAPSRPALAPAAGVALLALGQFFFNAWPLSESQRLLQEFRAALVAPDARAAAELGRAAVAADPLDPEAPREVARTLMAVAAGSGDPASGQLARIEAAEGFADEARRRNPASASHWRLLARIATERARVYELSDDPRAADALQAAAGHWEETLARDPTNERGHLAAALTWGRLWGYTKNPQHAGRVCRHLDAALAIDATRPPENASKLRPDELERIEQMRAELAAADAGCGEEPATPP